MVSQFSPLFVATLVDISLKSLLIALVALIVVWLARLRDSAILHCVWSLVVVGMLCLPLLTLIAPSIPALPRASVLGGEAPMKPAPQAVPHSVPSAQAVAPSTTPFGHAGPSLVEDTEPYSTSAAAISPAEVSLGGDESTAAPREPLRTPFPYGALLLLYALVSSFLLGRMLLGVVLAHRLVNRATPIEEGDLGHTLCGATTLVESSEVRVPLTTGLLRPAIVFPEDWRSWPDDLVRMALTHEREHVRRRDVWFTLASQLNTALYWFHPVAWLVRRRLSVLAEQVCDDAVIRSAGDRGGYAESLVAMASRLATGGQRVAPLAIGMARRMRIEDRIEAVIDPERPLSKRLTKLVGLTLLAIAVPVCTLVAGLRPWEQAAASEPASEVDGQVERRIEPDAAPSESLPAPPPISGRVVMADTQQPAPNAEVRLTIWNKNATGYKKESVRTDENGEFLFKEYGEGKLKIAAYDKEASSRTKRYGGLEVEPGAKEILLELKPMPALRVRVVSQDEESPIEGARVRLTWTDGKREHNTDAQGEVTIRCLTAETWTIEVHAKGLAEDEQAINLPATGVTTVVSRLSVGAELRGVVRDSQAAPLAGVGISVFPADFRGGQIEYMKTNDQGEYRFPCLPIKTVKLMLSKDGYQDVRRDVVLRGGSEAQQFDLTLPKRPDGGSVAGVVTDANGSPIVGARVANRGRSSSDLREALTDSDGRFRLDDVFRGSSGHELFVRAEGYAARPVSFQPGSADDPAELTVTLEDGHRISGKVVDEMGAPLSGVRVYYAGGNRFPGIDLGGNTTTGADGRFQFNSLPDDCPFSFSKRAYSEIVEEKLPLDGESEVEVTLLSEGVILGQVVDAETGEPVSPITVHITFSPDRTNADPSAGLGGSRATGPGERFATRDGTFRLGDLVRGMPLQVTVEADGYRRVAKRRVVATQEAEAQPSVFRLSRIKPESLLRLAGRLINQSGQPVQGIELRLIVAAKRPFPRDRFPFNWEMIQNRGGAGGVAKSDQVRQFLSGVTDAEGRFEFEQVEPGEDLEIAYWGAGVARDRVAKLEQLDEDERADITIKAVAGGVVRGTIDRERYPEVSNVILSAPSGFFRDDLTPEPHKFEFRDIPAGDYELQVYSPMWRDDSSLGSLSSNVLKRVPLTVRSGETHELTVRGAKKPPVKRSVPQPEQSDAPRKATTSDKAEVRTAPTSTSHAVVQGQVVDTNGKPVTGARLLLPLTHSAKDEGRLVQDVSDEDGRFLMSVPTEWIKPDDYASHYVLWCLHSEQRLAAVGVYKQLAKGSTEAIRIELEPSTDTGFLVTNTAGEPVAGALVEPWHFLLGSYDIIPYSFRQAIGATTDEQGRVRLPAMGRDGFYTVRVTADGFGVQQLRLRDTADEPAMRSIKLRPTGRLTGRLQTDDRRDIQSAKVHVYQEDFIGQHTYGEASAKVDEQRRFEVDAFAEGPIKLIVRVDKDLKTRPRIPENLHIYAGKETSVDIPFEPTVRVRGRVQTKQNAEPVSGALLSVSYGSFRQSEQVRTDADGRFEVNALSGEFRQQLISKPRSFSNWVVEKAGWQRPVTVPKQASSFDLPPLELVETAERQGTLTDYAGNPVARAEFWAVTGNRRYGFTRTDENGEFKIRLPESLVVEEYGVSIGREMFRGRVEVVSESPLSLRLND